MRLLVLDAHNLIYRAYYALPYLSAPDGQPTHAAFGFTSMLLSLLSELDPKFLAVAIDVPGEEPSFREEAYPEYKANRPPMPDDLVSQLPLISQIADAFRIPVIGGEGYEADDVLGTLSALAEERGVETILATGDQDAYQLVSDLTRVCSTDRSLKKNIVIGRDEVIETLGVPPEKVPDFKALTGDPSDNIPGVPGIGPKRAVQLLNQFGSLEGVLDHLDDIENARWRAALAETADMARRWKEICRIVRDVPLEASLDDLTRKGPDEERIRELFGRLGFRTLLERTLGRSGPQVGETETAGKWERVEDAKAARAVLQSLRKRGRCAVFLGGGEAESGVALAAGSAGTFFFLLGGQWPVASGQQSLPISDHYAPRPTPHAPLATLLADGSVEKIGHDTKELERSLHRLGLALAGVEFDSLLAAYLLNPGESDLSLPRIAKSHLNVDLPAPSDPGGACAAAQAIWQLREPLLSQLKQAGPAGGQPSGALPRALPGPQRRGSATLGSRASTLADLFFDVELPLSHVLAKMEERGVRVNAAALRALGEELGREIARSEEAVYRLAGETFTINSPKQLQVILFEKLKLPAGRKTKTGYSTDADVLADLASQHEIVRHILDYRANSKLKSTYADALADLVDPRTGRIHTRFNQAAVATGRLSSSDPNLQNIPVRTEAGRMVRRCFVAPSADDVLLSCDYSQIELRILAHFSEDPRLCAAFNEGQDIHVQTAAQVFGVPPEEVSSEMRDRAKTVNFGVIYGMGPVALARQLGISREEARDFIDRYFATFEGVRRFIDATVARAKGEGYVTTLLGRRRYLPELSSERNEVRAFGERAAVNTPIQGTAADMIKVAMLRVDCELGIRNSEFGIRGGQEPVGEQLACSPSFGRRQAPPLRSELGTQNSYLILQVHDELLFEVPKAHAADLAKRVCEIMAGVLALRVPIVVEAKSGPNWGEMEGVVR